MGEVVNNNNPIQEKSLLEELEIAINGLSLEELQRVKSGFNRMVDAAINSKQIKQK